MKKEKPPRDKPSHLKNDRGRWCTYKGKRYLVHWRGVPLMRSKCVALISTDQYSSLRHWVDGYEITLLPDDPLDLGPPPRPANAMIS